MRPVDINHTAPTPVERGSGGSSMPPTRSEVGHADAGRTRARTPEGNLMSEGQNDGAAGQNGDDGSASKANDNGYTPPASQEEFDHILGRRLEAERAKFADYDDLKAKAAKFDEAEEANKTELQKLAERAEAAERRAAEFEAKEQRATWASEVAGKTGVPADVLRGSTKEELEAHAEQLKPHFTKEPPKRTPVPPGKSRTSQDGSRAVAAMRGMRRGA